ncbi:MAG: hypothetical protein A2Y62_19650 [Candidatus Fischerbacteria bacterium RBG_13_37_8]|uniref:Fibronectin type-III domain-containing protein n=1 Tax=Candidatus Fischerbacteria bacterium RBG_13_37_8 TaxID=1817863 RepID=A0A1F5V9E8_9BACT|nr:MAG: hypothetical protein A2Y62_19650 [Candidatus Fischerbacteria bacterium RBG_13_37_8]
MHMKNKSKLILLLLVLFLFSCSSENPLSPLLNTGRVPMPVSPADGAVLNQPVIRLVVHNATGYDGSPSLYLFEISTSQNFDTLYITKEIPAGIGSTIFTPAKSFDAGQLYYWRSKAMNAGNQTEFSPVFVFIIQTTNSPLTQISPLANQIELNRQVVLKVQNSPNFSSKYDYYHFEIYRVIEPNISVIERDVPAQSEYTELRVQENLPEGAYKWRVRAYHLITGEIESTLYTEYIRFYIADDCNNYNNGPWAISIVTDSLECLSVNDYPNPNEALGSPNAAEHAPKVYSGIVSLGIDGWIVVEMGRCIHDGAGYDLIVYQSVSYEGVGVQVAETPEGPWHWLGVRSCGDPSPYYSHVCYFDLSYSGKVQWARYVKVIDFSRATFPDATCDNDLYTPGADIDAVQVIH